MNIDDYLKQIITRCKLKDVSYTDFEYLRDSFLNSYKDQFEFWLDESISISRIDYYPEQDLLVINDGDVFINRTYFNNFLNMETT